jgi:hypothetical protein
MKATAPAWSAAPHPAGPCVLAHTPSSTGDRAGGVPPEALVPLSHQLGLHACYRFFGGCAATHPERAINF